MQRPLLHFSGFILLCFLSLSAMAFDYPKSRHENTTNTYHGVKVEDPYQWLEDWSSEEVKNWSASQNEVARNFLDALPKRDEIARRVESVMSADTVSYYSGQRLGDKAWFMKYAPPKQQPFLIEIDADGNQASERVIFDPQTADESGSTSVEWFHVSPNGKLVAIALTVAGAEVADLQILDLLTGKQVDKVVPRVNGPTAGGDLGWDADSSGFYYTRYPRDGEKSAADQNFYQQVWHRKLGTPLSADKYELGELFDRIAEIRIQVHEDSGKVLATMQYGDSGRFQLYLRELNGSWYQLSAYDDQLVQAQFIDTNTLLVLSRHSAPRGKFMRMDISKLVIEGGSNGGLLMGAMIVQHPQDFRATVSHVGIYDSVRSELSPNGAFNIPEFGTVTDPVLFKALYAYSPYHHVAQTAYPSILFMTGENDGRVDPMHSRKMTAALQHANTSKNPVLLRTSGNTGHGSGTPLSEAISQQVDRLAFLFNSLGMQYKTVQEVSAH